LLLLLEVLVLLGDRLVVVLLELLVVVVVLLVLLGLLAAVQALADEAAPVEGDLARGVEDGARRDGAHARQARVLLRVLLAVVERRHERGDRDPLDVIGVRLANDLGHGAS
jgi:hypothetical protein